MSIFPAASPEPQNRMISRKTPLPPLLFLLVVLLLSFSGCGPKSTGVPLDTPPVVLPDSFSEMGQQQSNRQWWLELGDEQLKFLIDKALAGNQELMVYRERLVQAEALARKAGADRWPSLDFSGSAQKRRFRSNSTTDNSSNLLLGFAASYEIDIWGRLQAQEESALFEVQASAEDLQAAALSLAAQLSNVWYQLAAAYRQLSLLEQQQEVNKMGLELVDLRFRSGQIGIADLLQQRQLIESKTGELAQQRARARVLENQLAILCGLSPGMLTLKDKPALINLPQLPATGFPSDLLTNRPDLRSRYLSLQAADRRVAEAIADKYPRIGLTAALNTSGSSTRDLFDNWLASLAANLAAPLLDGGSRQAEVERSRALAREKLHSYGEALLTAVGEVEDALIQEREQQHFLDSLELQLDLANRTVESLKDRYKQGTVDYQRILTALLSQQSLQRNLVSSRQQLISYRIDLYRALGGQVPDLQHFEHQKNASQPAK